VGITNVKAEPAGWLARQIHQIKIGMIEQAQGKAYKSIIQKSALYQPTYIIRIMATNVLFTPKYLTILSIIQSKQELNGMIKKSECDSSHN
jgi:hypothetical protein